MAKEQILAYDLFVIGAGSGGVRAARLAAAMGKKTAIAESYRLGGTCVIRGCVPKKLMVYAAEYRQILGQAKAFGWDVTASQFDWPSFMLRRDQEVARLEKIYQKLLEDNKVDIYKSHARFLDAHHIELSESGQKIYAKNIIIATGSSPALPQDVGGIEYALNSNQLLALPSLPKSMVIVGGGYISLEFASILHNFGVKISVICRRERLLKDFDAEIAQRLQSAMSERGIKFYMANNVSKITPIFGHPDGKFTIHLTDGKELISEEIFYATGRRPASDGLALDKAGIDCDAQGKILTNQYKQTKQKHIYAIGDVAGDIQLTPVAIHEAICVINSLYKGQASIADHEIIPDYELIPTAIFCQPELGTVGPTEDEAVRLYQDIDIYVTSFRPMKATLAGDKEQCFMKIIVERQSDIVRAVHLLGHHSAEMIQLIAIAVKNKVTKAGFDATMALHPTASEELVTLYKPSYSYQNGQRQA